MSVYIEINERGETFYYKDKELRVYHREDGPAVTLEDGSLEWWVNGRIHRDDGPAVVLHGAYESWWKNGKLHREEGPAVVFENGKVQYWLEGTSYEDEGAWRANLPRKTCYVTVQEVAEAFGVDPQDLRILRGELSVRVSAPRAEPDWS